MILEMTGFFVDKRQGLAPRGNPKYLIGKVSPRQKKKKTISHP
jgi:hypothetical protein